MSKRPVRLRAMGMNNCLGLSLEEIYPRLIAGCKEGFSETEEFVPGRKLQVGAVTAKLPELAPSFERRSSRTAQLAVQSYQQISTEVQESIQLYGAERVAVVIGTSSSGITVGEERMREYVQNGVLSTEYAYTRQEPGAIAELVAEYAGTRGVVYTVSTACSSSAKALVSARNLLHAGVCDAVIAGGADALCRLSLNGFSSLEALSYSRSNPMSVNRDGISIGEGACLFLVDKGQGGVQILGSGESSDAHHISSPDPKGAGVEKGVSAALKDAECTPEDICYLNLHGTGTKYNDAMESEAISRIFGTKLPCSSTKPLVGHTLGAAGAMEAGFCYLALQQAGPAIKLPPHVWDGVRDHELAEICLVQAGDEISAEGQVRVLSSSYAFGGNNCVLVLGREF